MQATLNAVGIIILLFLTISVLRRFFIKPDNHFSIIKSVCCFSFFLFLFVLIQPTICLTNTPNSYLLLLCTLLSLIISNIKSKLSDKFIIFIIIIGIFVLIVHRMYLVCGEEYTGFTKYAQGKNDKNEMKLRELINFLEYQRNIQNKPYPEGWIEESLSDVKLIKTDNIQFYYEQSDTWHTFFTGIYVVRKEPIGVWYPGGLLKSSYNKIILKRRK